MSKVIRKGMRVRVNSPRDRGVHNKTGVVINSPFRGYRNVRLDDGCCFFLDVIYLTPLYVPKTKLDKAIYAYTRRELGM